MSFKLESDVIRRFSSKAKVLKSVEYAYRISRISLQRLSSTGVLVSDMGKKCAAKCPPQCNLLLASSPSVATAYAYDIITDIINPHYELSLSYSPEKKDQLD